MTKRVLSFVLALLMVVGMLPAPVRAADTLEEAMAEVNIYAKDQKLNWLTMNGSVKTQEYTYYNYRSAQTGETKEIPAYCVDPRLYGVPAKTSEGTPIKYTAESTVNDPKICGIISNGYPHMTLNDLGLQTKEEAYYATKTAVWIYLLGNWTISGLGVNPNLSGADKEAAQRVMQATKTIYQRGMYWNELYSPKLTATADTSKATPVTINGAEYYQQVFTIDSNTWALTPIRVSLAEGAPAGAVVMNMDNDEISQVNFSVCNFSGGKDSTAMLLLMIERDMPIDMVIFADTGMDFPEITEHIQKVDAHLYRERGIHITTLKAAHSFEWYMFDEPKQKPSALKRRAELGVPPYGNGWPGIKVRWCTGQLKTHIIRKEVNRLKAEKNAVHFIGIAADEAWRCKDERYPLVEWNITEADALQVCYDRGFDFGGVYQLHRRVSCWCCPFQRISELRALREHHPELWARLLDMDNRARTQFGPGPLGQFKKDWSVERLEERFAREESSA